MLELKSIKYIRVIAILSILIVHTFGIFYFPKFITVRGNSFLGEDVLEMSNWNFLLSGFVINMSKFGTITFFIISGFLFQNNYDKYKESFNSFVRKKYKALLRPYILVFLLPIMIFYLISPYIGNKEEISFKIYITNVLKEIFLTNYWFIPTLVLYFIINFFLPSKRVLLFMILSGLITLFFSLNLYLKVLPFTNHTLTGIGFIFFFILGRVICLKSFSICNNKILLIVLLIISFLCSMAESWWIYFRMHNGDFVNTLRISNIAFSLIVLEILNKLFLTKKLPLFLNNVNTYFIYLFHPHVITVLERTMLLTAFYRIPHYFFPISVFATIVLVIVLFFIEFISRRIKFIGYSLQDFIFNSKKNRVISTSVTNSSLERKEQVVMAE